jgi:acyl-CoA dehydrogenase
MPIGKMEGVREKFLAMFYNTWVIQSAVNHTCHILDSGVTPSVLTAIMKQQTTERARTVMLHGMDIYAGSAICRGRNNFFTKFYNGSPVGITVEGSNTLTRSLIIFGQGLNKSHPYIYKLFDTIQSNNLAAFQTQFKEMILFSTNLYFSSIWPFSGKDRLETLVKKFANLSNFVALRGGRIKSEQMISGTMADILSNIYLAKSVIWYHNNVANDVSPIIKQYCIDRLLDESEEKLNTVIANYPQKTLRTLLRPTMCTPHPRNFKNETVVFETILKDVYAQQLLKDNLFYENTVLEDLEKLTAMKTDGNHKEKEEEYKQLYQKVINVGEYTIPK